MQFKSLLKTYLLAALQGIFLALIASVVLIIALSLASCEPEPISWGNQKALPAEQNFLPEPEKIWTEADFRQAEIDPLEVDYLARDHKTGALPDNVTAEDMRLIQHHTQQRLARLQAVQSPQEFAKK